MATQVFLKGSEVLYQKNQEWSLYINFFTGPCGRAWTIRKEACIQEHLFEDFSNEDSSGFLDHISIIFNNKTDPKDS